MRDNEPLGLYEELRERAEKYASQSEATRRRILGIGPVTPDGAHAETVNPFDLPPRLRLKNGGRPFHRRPRLDAPPQGFRRRAIWPEAALGLNVLQVVQAVVLESGLTAGELLDSSHKKRVSWPRQAAMWAIDRYCPEYSLPEIAYMFHRDHTTVMHAIEATNVRVTDGNPETKDLIARVRQRLQDMAK